MWKYLKKNKQKIHKSKIVQRVMQGFEVLLCTSGLQVKKKQQTKQNYLHETVMQSFTLQIYRLGKRGVINKKEVFEQIVCCQCTPGTLCVSHKNHTQPHKFWVSYAFENGNTCIKLGFQPPSKCLLVVQ